MMPATFNEIMDGLEYESLKRFRAIKERGGFLTEDDLRLIVEVAPKCQVLIRSQMGRFRVAAEQARHYIDLLEASDTDSLRDVCIPAIG